MKLAVSGVAGSFSEEAGLLYAQRLGRDVELVYAVDMEGVLAAVDEDRAEQGIFPVVNSRGGLVRSAFDAMGRHNFVMHDEVWFEVYQCLMALSGVQISDVNRVVSHPQAIAQCERYLKKTFPDAKLVEWEDTAKAAEDLALGKFDRQTAVIAPMRSAHLYELDVLEKGIHDNHPNLTTFIIVSK